MLEAPYRTAAPKLAAITPPVVLMESRMRWKSQVRFGGRRRGDHQPKGRHRRLAADPALRVIEGYARSRADAPRPSGRQTPAAID